jgi:membrane-bound serine protease (ClpP class)
LELFIPIALVLVGIALIGVEIYLVPGFNLVGVLGFVVVLFGVGYAFSEMGFLGGLYTLIGTVVVAGGLFYLAWTSGAWNRFILATSIRSDESASSRESEHRAKYLGKNGTAITPLRPTGVAEIDGERIEVVTEGEFIAAGSRIRVVAMDRRRFFVRLSDAVVQESQG